MDVDNGDAVEDVWSCRRRAEVGVSEGISEEEGGQTDRCEQLRTPQSRNCPLRKSEWLPHLARKPSMPWNNVALEVRICGLQD